MFPFLESIRLEQNQLYFLKEHENRFRCTQQDNWGKVLYQDLESILLNSPDLPGDAHKYKCRLVYDEQNIQLSFIPYRPRTIEYFRIVQKDDINYTYKSTDRSALDQLTRDLPPKTEILIFKNGLLTDSSFSNLALFDGQQWYTPKKPLLKGVHRSYLLQKGILKEMDIPIEDLQRYKRIRLINAMMDWEHTWETNLVI